MMNRSMLLVFCILLADKKKDILDRKPSLFSSFTSHRERRRRREQKLGIRSLQSISHFLHTIRRRRPRDLRSYEQESIKKTIPNRITRKHTNSQPSPERNRIPDRIPTKQTHNITSLQSKLPNQSRREPSRCITDILP